MLLKERVLKIVTLAGGVGGAKLVDGLAKILSPEELSVIVNTGDDFEYLSLRISPDLDTVCYTLAGLANPDTGWGRAQETWQTFEEIGRIGGPDWFRLGDLDLATHLVRTTRLQAGETLSEITVDLCQDWGVVHPVFPMSDDPVRTIVHTETGEALGFQEYFVHQACQPVVRSFEFRGIEEAKPITKAVDALAACDLVLFSPSNPWVSIDPILAVPGLRELVSAKPVVVVSPLVGGKALKGPAAKMYQELGLTPNAFEVARHYQDLITGFVFDLCDQEELEKIERCRIIPLVTDIVMKNKQDRVRLAEEVLNFCGQILNRSR
jgi:LPPG:FO 2-phospho-L-lactate transferase